MKKTLKTLPKYFTASWAGVKTFEIRKNDRDFELHDEIVLEEHDGENYTGREIHAFITYVTRFQQQDGYVVFSFAESGRIES